jgi:hypothetical protein
MSKSHYSAMDALVDGQTGDLKTLTDELTELNFQLRKILDAGLPPDQFTFFQGLKKASETAQAIVQARK